jgi:hypothetical protein
MAIISLDLQGTDKARLLALGTSTARFIAAKTLTQTAQAVQTEVKKHIRSAFVLRKPNFEKSIKVRPATKSDLSAKVYTMAGFAALQQTGGRQLPHGGRLAVPLYSSLRDVKANRKSDPAGSFLLRLKSGGVAIAARQSSELKILYMLKNLAYMPKRLNMLEIGEEVSMREIPRLFAENLGSATNLNDRG